MASVAPAWSEDLRCGPHRYGGQRGGHAAGRPRSAKLDAAIVDATLALLAVRGYNGLTLSFGDLDAKLEFAAPVLDRVRYLHGRVASSGCIQVDVGDGSSDGEPPVTHFKQMWTRGFTGFLANVADDPCPPTDLAVGFAPELLPPEVGYARLVPGFDGEPREEGDRWTQGMVLTRLAAECFVAAEVAQATTTEVSRGI